MSAAGIAKFGPARRGIERRLLQFTIVLIALFSLFSLASYLLTSSIPAA